MNCECIMNEESFSFKLRMNASSAGCLKRYTKLIKLNLKLITSIINMYLFLSSTQYNLNFEPLLVGIQQVLREIWLFEREFQARNFGQRLIF